MAFYLCSQAHCTGKISIIVSVRQDQTTSEHSSSELTLWAQWKISAGHFISWFYTLTTQTLAQAAAGLYLAIYHSHKLVSETKCVLLWRGKDCFKIKAQVVHCCFISNWALVRLWALSWFCPPACSLPLSLLFALLVCKWIHRLRLPLPAPLLLACPCPFKMIGIQFTRASGWIDAPWTRRIPGNMRSLNFWLILSVAFNCS